SSVKANTPKTARNKKFIDVYLIKYMILRNYPKNAYERLLELLIK
ncbi:hypothetical protein ENBRE01_3354, partial [Enteropsectra breve]